MRKQGRESAGVAGDLYVCEMEEGVMSEVVEVSL